MNRRRGVCLIPTELLHEWLDLPDDCAVTQVFQTPSDMKQGRFRIVCYGEGMPSSHAEDEPPLVVLHLQMTGGDRNALKLKEITSPDRELVFWPIWPPIDE